MNLQSIVVKNDVHQKYGCSYPLTYHFTIPPNSQEISVSRKYSSSDPWSTIQEKTPNDHFNGVEAVRFERELSNAYISVPFSPESDTIHLKFNGTSGAPIAVQFQSITKYYDNRKAAVTVTADDWADWSDYMWGSLLSLFRSNGLYVTTGIIADSIEWSTQATWQHIQRQLDSGFIEAASHSGTHPHTPYNNLTKEVYGSHDNIVKKLQLPLHSRNGASEYVYVWIAPYGEYDKSIDSLLQHRSYIVPRLYYIGEGVMSTWDDKKRSFAPMGLTLEIGLPSWGGGTADTGFMNGSFRSIVSAGGVYHVMWHPQVIYPDRNKSYLLNHLSYIGKRNDLWYVNLGYLYLYRFLQQANSPAVSGTQLSANAPGTAHLDQNYPNPCNPSTTIRFRLDENPTSARDRVSLKVFDILGKEIVELAGGQMAPGDHSIDFNASGLPSGLYFYRLQYGSQSETRKMMFIQ